MKEKKISTIEALLDEYVKAESNLQNLLRHLENIHKAQVYKHKSKFGNQIGKVKQVRTALSCGKTDLIMNGVGS